MALGHGVGRLADHEDDGPQDHQARPINGFAAETTAAIIISPASHFGIPVSHHARHLERDHGRRRQPRLRGVHWGVARRILFAWVLTIPAAGVFGALTWYVLNAIGFG